MRYCQNILKVHEQSRLGNLLGDLPAFHILRGRYCRPKCTKVRSGKVRRYETRGRDHITDRHRHGICHKLRQTDTVTASVTIGVRLTLSRHLSQVGVRLTLSRHLSQLCQTDTVTASVTSWCQTDTVTAFVTSWCQTDTVTASVTSW
ncbi:hypothetical protein J6590_020273 [Homalodisca vitripennis]|nr:hypothetical protein J6590_020273 [Homalodisca vitripennis]